MKKGSRHLKDEVMGILNGTKWDDYFEEISPGVLVWKRVKKNSHMKQGEVAGWIDDRGYCRITWRENGKSHNIFRHHIIWVMHNGKFRVENNKGGKRNYIGTFSNFESAASALIEWEVMNGY